VKDDTVGAAMGGFAVQNVSTWAQLLKLERQLRDEWLFREQPADWPLQTTLDRALTAYGVRRVEAPAVEEQLVRDFRRRYHGTDNDLVERDYLHCLALMQHPGAPTRLLDVTYSFFLACFFALDSLKPPSQRAVVWAVRRSWTLEATRRMVPDIEQRNVDEKRDDASFRRFYVDRHQRFVFHENPFRLNPRLAVQQGGFLCPGDIRADFRANVRAMEGWGSRGNVREIVLDLHTGLRPDAMRELLRMNVSRASLFPGLDGLAASYAQRLPLLQALAATRAGRHATPQP
jgi:hypothetical protein